MKRMLCITMLSASILSGTLASAASIRVLTYNMMGMKPDTDPETRIEHIITNLERLEPDIIGLQEINETLDGEYNQAQIIVDSLTANFGIEYYLYMEFTHLSWDNQFREYIGIISRYPILEQGYGQLVVGAFPRKVVWTAVDSPAGRLNVFNTHLSFTSADVRKLQVQQIIGFITYTENLSPGVASILTGDFNDEPDSETILLLTEPGTETFYIDTYAFSNPNLPGYTVPSSSPTARIDYIFEKSTGRLAIDTSVVVMDEPYDGTNYCSDHLGVLTIFPEELGATHTSSQKPSFSLLPPQPNPTSGRVVIPYVLARQAPVSLSIYTISGYRVRTLFSEAQPAGFQWASWDCRDAGGFMVSSAPYVVRLEAEGMVRDARLTVVR